MRSSLIDASKGEQSKREGKSEKTDTKSSIGDWLARSVGNRGKRNVTYVAPDYRQDVSRALSLSLHQESFPPHPDHDESTAASRLILPRPSPFCPSAKYLGTWHRGPYNQREKRPKTTRKDLLGGPTASPEPSRILASTEKPVQRGPRRNEAFQGRGKDAPRLSNTGNSLWSLYVFHETVLSLHSSQHSNDSAGYPGPWASETVNVSSSLRAADP